MPHTIDEKKAAFARILQIMDELRAGCPWDRKQTIETLRLLTIEEVYELTGAIDSGNWDDIKEELGDVLLHIVFYAKIGDEQNRFDIADVINSLCEKLIIRHPHIYGDVKVQDEHEVSANWEKIKGKQKKKHLLSGVPDGLPAMVKAYRVQDKAKQVGFEWDNMHQVWDKVEEEMREFKEAATAEEREKEFGDILFSLVNYARMSGLDPEAALEKTNRKFINRFNEMEKRATDAGRSLHDMTLDEMDAIWNAVKPLYP
jgi:XTP/dITP diphosphohydrolase